MRIQGIIPPVATPMQANEDLDLPRLRWFLDRLVGAGVHGVFVLGTNSEFYALDEREKSAARLSADIQSETQSPSTDSPSPA